MNKIKSYQILGLAQWCSKSVLQLQCQHPIFVYSYKGNNVYQKANYIPTMTETLFTAVRM